MSKAAPLLLSKELRCALCHRHRRPEGGGYCICGASVWEPQPLRPVEGIRFETLEGGQSLRPRPYRALLSEALGGIVLGFKILVGGKPGVGKSTLAAELAAEMARKLNGNAFWLDAEQNTDVVRELFLRTGSSPDRIIRVSKTNGAGWREAFRSVPKDAAVVVIDSLQRWASQYREQTALLEALNDVKPTAIVISHFNKAGRFAGPVGNEYDVDATVIVAEKRVEVTKCRWSACPRSVKRPVEFVRKGEDHASDVDD
jgi:predicted ATP-dependent serine protease